jgi:ribosomal-protein-alanine N-acetyltransferase
MGFATNDGKQYVIAGPWRHRDDIAELIEASRGDLRCDLLDALIDELKANGYRLIVLDYGLEANDPDFYRRGDFRLVERILEFERPDLPLATPPTPDRFEVQTYQPSDREAILDLERNSFPWLWWNSSEEWDRYVITPAVEVLVGRIDGRIVGYAGFVVHRRDGHLDRLAVSEAEQGRGFGASLLSASLSRMSERGAKLVTLTTQEQNFRSQKLYEQNGFRRGRWTYEIYGRWLDTAEGNVR